jgi:hypothetical protein
MTSKSGARNAFNLGKFQVEGRGKIKETLKKQEKGPASRALSNRIHLSELV